ncbi:hypothetical protein J6590_036605 [Homalodisca vitripennis]|nr:hypothetical protein J6590_036605 [Homalodisca vitripennis]
MAGYLQGQDRSAVKHLPRLKLLDSVSSRHTAPLAMYMMTGGSKRRYKDLHAQKAINRAEIKLSTSKIFRTYSQRDQLQRLKHEGFVSAVLKEAVIKNSWYTAVLIHRGI